jgi:3'(2'), 5'-bisphosphate nucleotidase
MTRDDHDLAAELAAGAGELLLDTRRRMLAVGAGVDELRAEGDRTSHEWLMAGLSCHRPGDAVLSEEATADDAHDRVRAGVARVWIVDPLDGTREYAEDRDDWAVHVALVESGRPVAGAVALPAQGVVFGTAAPPPVPPAHSPLRVVVSRTRPPVEATRIAEALGAELVAMGSAGAKAMSILQGRSDLYPHSGGQYEWDSAAPVAVATAAGLHCSRLDGSPLRYNREDPWLPDLLVCRPEHVEAVMEALGPGTAES